MLNGVTKYNQRPTSNIVGYYTLFKAYRSSNFIFSQIYNM